MGSAEQVRVCVLLLFGRRTVQLVLASLILFQDKISHPQSSSFSVLFLFFKTLLEVRGMQMMQLLQLLVVMNRKSKEQYANTEVYVKCTNILRTVFSFCQWEVRGTLLWQKFLFCICTLSKCCCFFFLPGYNTRLQLLAESVFLRMDS